MRIAPGLASPVKTRYDPRVRSRDVLVWVFVVGCAHAPPPVADTPPAQAEACVPESAVTDAERALETCRGAHASDATWAGRDARDALEASLSAHLASLRPPRTVEPGEVQPLAEALWALLDRAALPPGSRATEDRAEAAAERLLRDRGEDACVAAAEEALEVTREIATVADPTHGTDPCEAETLAARRATLERALCAEPTSGGEAP